MPKGPEDVKLSPLPPYFQYATLFRPVRWHVVSLSLRPSFLKDLYTFPGWLCRSHEFCLGTFSRSQGWEYGSENQLKNAGKAWHIMIVSWSYHAYILCPHFWGIAMHASMCFFGITKRQESKSLRPFDREAIRALPWLQWGWWRAIVACLIWTADVVSASSQNTVGVVGLFVSKKVWIDLSTLKVSSSRSVCERESAGATFFDIRNLTNKPPPHGEDRKSVV